MDEGALFKYLNHSINEAGTESLSDIISLNGNLYMEELEEVIKEQV